MIEYISAEAHQGVECCNHLRKFCDLDATSNGAPDSEASAQASNHLNCEWS